jgi:hypothetical protein
MLRHADIASLWLSFKAASRQAALKQINKIPGKSLNRPGSISLFSHPRAAYRDRLLAANAGVRQCTG